MKLFTAIIALALGGCAAFWQQPTFEYCDRVSYQRTGNAIDITAHCAAPIGQGNLPVPVKP